MALIRSPLNGLTTGSPYSMARSLIMQNSIHLASLTLGQGVSITLPTVRQSGFGSNRDRIYNQPSYPSPSRVEPPRKRARKGPATPPRQEPSYHGNAKSPRSEQEKRDFLLKIGLVTHELNDQIKHRKSERSKRRPITNSQLSSYVTYDLIHRQRSSGESSKAQDGSSVKTPKNSPDKSFSGVTPTPGIATLSGGKPPGFKIPVTTFRSFVNKQSKSNSNQLNTTSNASITTDPKGSAALPVKIKVNPVNKRSEAALSPRKRLLLNQKAGSGRGVGGIACTVCKKGGLAGQLMMCGKCSTAYHGQCLHKAGRKSTNCPVCYPDEKSAETVATGSAVAFTEAVKLEDTPSGGLSVNLELAEGPSTDGPVAPTSQPQDLRLLPYPQTPPPPVCGQAEKQTRKENPQIKAEAMGLVNKYITVKAEKEDAKRRLVRRKVELLQEKNHSEQRLEFLENRLKHWREDQEKMQHNNGKWTTECDQLSKALPLLKRIRVESQNRSSSFTDRGNSNSSWNSK